MQPQFTSGDPRLAKLRTWSRTYRVPLGMTGAFLAVLVLFSVAPSPGRSSPEATPPPPTVAPERSPCIACGIGERCDELTGTCVLDTETPTPCEKGTHFEEDLGYCVPDPTPEPTPPPSQTLAPDATPRTTPRPTPEPTPEEGDEEEEEPPSDPDATPWPTPGWQTHPPS